MGEPANYSVFVAVNSGEFNNPSTWSDGVVPYGRISIVISAGITVTISNAAMSLAVARWDLFGSLAVGSSANASFVFEQSTNLVVHSGGSLQDRTSAKSIFCRTGTQLTFHPGGSFTGSNTIIRTFTALPALANVGVNFTLGSSISGPFTCGIISSTQVQSFTKVTFITAASGNFRASGTWLAGNIPTADTCRLVGGCGLFISSGCRLSTADLNGQLDINFSSVTITSGAFFQLNSGSSGGGFTFAFAISIIVQAGGSLQDQTSTNRIYCLSSSVLTFFSGASFSGSNTVIFKFSSLPASGSLGANFTIGSSISGAFTFAILRTGEIQTFNRVTFIAAVSGSITATGTWLGGTAPTVDTCASAGGCGLFISSGCTLSTADLNGQLDINFSSVTITSGASLQLNSGRSGDFTFAFAVSIIVQAGGSLQDQTSTNRIYCLSSSVLTFFSGASFSGSNTVIFKFSSLPASGSLGANFTIGSSISGAFTFAILRTGEIQTFNRVTFIAAVSGSFTATGTWLGGIAPTANTCASAGGCGLFISSGCALSTSSLSGELNINFNTIEVSADATFELGTSSISTGFRFLFALEFTIHGTLSFSAAAGNLLLPFGSAFNFFITAIFQSSFTVQVRTFDLAVGGQGSLVVSIDSSFTGPFFVEISTGGTITETSERTYNLSIRIYIKACFFLFYSIHFVDFYCQYIWFIHGFSNLGRWCRTVRSMYSHHSSGNFNHFHWRNT